jgi:hypothetical protein
MSYRYVLIKPPEKKRLLEALHVDIIWIHTVIQIGPIVCRGRDGSSTIEAPVSMPDELNPDVREDEYPREG